MPLEIALFWMVVAGFLLADNLVFVPHGCELLRVGRRGAIRYDAAPRMSFARREVVLLNPLNFFDRALITTQCFGDVDPNEWRKSRSLMRSALPLLNGLNLLGYTYLILTSGLAFLSINMPFALVLTAFAVLHALMWLACSAVLISERRTLRLETCETAALCAEAAFVPAYLMNLGKRALRRHRAGVSALGLGLRNAKRTEGEGEREWKAVSLLDRLQWLSLMQGHEEYDAAVLSKRSTLTATQVWIRNAEACLKR